MRTALILTGHMRCWKQMLPYIKQKFIEPYNADVFISCWETEGWWQWQAPKGFYEGSSSVDPDEIRALLNPVEMRFEHYPSHDQYFSERAKQYTNSYIDPKNILSMTYKWLDGFYLLKHHMAITGKKYDLVLKTRTDLEVFGDFPQFDLDKFYIIYNHYDQGGYNDVFYASNYEKAEYVANFVLNFDHLYSQTNTVCTHLMTQKYFENAKIEVTELHIPYKLHNTPWGQHQDVYRFITNK